MRSQIDPGTPGAESQNRSFSRTPLGRLAGMLGFTVVRWRTGTAGFVALATVVTGCSNAAGASANNPPIVAAAASCQRAKAASTTTQPVEIVVVGKRGPQRAANRYFTRFVELNQLCISGGTDTAETNWITFAPNVTAVRATKVAEILRRTGLFARVTEMTVPRCDSPGFKSGSCTPPTD